jgi:hypothetical protein
MTSSDMMARTDKIWSHLEQFLNGDLSIETFEAWLYENEADVSRVLGPIGHALIELDFRGAHPVHETKKLVAQAYDAFRPGELPRDYAIRVLREFLDGRRDVWSVSRTLAAIRFDLPEGTIPDEFVYIDSELDLIPHPSQERKWSSVMWQRLQEEKAPILAEYQRAARVVGTELLQRLTSSDGRTA